MYYSWEDIAGFGGCGTEGWIGLYAGRYNLDGSFDGAPVNMQKDLWNDRIYFIGDNHSKGYLDNYFIGSPQFSVDRDHWYALWAWCGGSVDGDGYSNVNGGTWFGSEAHSLIGANVPSISWDLLCNYPPN